MSEESGLTREEIEALTEDPRATDRGEGAASGGVDAEPDALEVRAQEPEAKS